ncbi:MAG TPA: hypothetical protein VHK69_00485 [Chitinophagaceae bacterium]|jgi:hypothetical protein|nr:hypothetical protein [Chitinophagaceae bacterium]
MRKVFGFALIIGLLSACNNPNPGESGAVNDGIKTVDENGALQDTAPVIPNPGIDSSLGEDRVDTERRDSAIQHKDTGTQRP